MAKSSTVDRKKPNAPWWVKVFVAFHVVAVTIWALPNPSPDYYTTPPKLTLEMDTSNVGTTIGSIAREMTDGLLVLNHDHAKFTVLSWYVLGTGFWQYWDMFSPNPVRVDMYSTADLVYADGHKSEFKYPRMYDLDVFRKYVQERYRKFYERANSFDYLWRPFVKRIAMLSDLPGDPVVSVTLVRHTMDLNGPGQPMPTDYVREEFFRATLVKGEWHYYMIRDKQWDEVGFA